MAKFKIDAAHEKCTGCLRCELACSELFTRSFNPSAARIRVVMRGSDCDISFTDECTQCCVCVQHCFYDALVATQQENTI